MAGCHLFRDQEILRSYRTPSTNHGERTEHLLLGAGMHESYRAPSCRGSAQPSANASDEKTRSNTCKGIPIRKRIVTRLETWWPQSTETLLMRGLVNEKQMATVLHGIRKGEDDPSASKVRAAQCSSYSAGTDRRRFVQLTAHLKVRGLTGARQGTNERRLSLSTCAFTSSS